MKKIFIVILLFILTISFGGCYKDPGNKSQYLLFNNNLIALQKDNKWGYYNQEGVKVIDFLYDKAYPFWEKAAVIMEGENYFLINAQGKKLNSLGYQYLEIDKETGLVWYQENNHLGLMKQDGKRIIDPVFDIKETSFSEGLAAVSIDGKIGFINKKGKMIIDPEYDEASAFAYGFSEVVKNGKHGYINQNNDVVVEIENEMCIGFNRIGIFLGLHNNKYNVFNKSGNKILSDLDKCYVSNNFILGIKNHKAYLYDLSGNKITDNYLDATTNHDFILLNTQIVQSEVINEEIKVTIYNSKFQKIYSFTAPSLSPNPDLIDNNIYSFIYNYRIHFAYEKEDKLIIVNENGEFELDQHYHFSSFRNGAMVVKKDNLYGVIDIVGRVMIDFNYQDINLFDDGIVVKKDGKYGVFDYEGQMIIPIEFDDYDYQVILKDEMHLLP